MAGPLRICCIRDWVIEKFPADFFKTKRKKKTPTGLKEQARPLAISIDGVWLPAVHRRFLSKGLAFFPEKMCLELTEAAGSLGALEFLRIWRNCAQEVFRGYLDSELLKLTAICTDAIATLPRTSFPDDKFASCLLSQDRYQVGALICRFQPQNGYL